MKPPRRGQSGGPAIYITERIGECLSDVFGFGFEGSQSRRWADRLNRRYSRGSKPPVDAEKIALLEGFDVREVPMQNRVAAVLEREPQTIYVTKNQEIYRKWGNFAIAAAMGHWYLEHTDKTYAIPVDAHPFTEFTPTVAGVDRFHAGVFAGHLLMSGKSMRRYNGFDLGIKAAGLQVPQEVVADWQAFSGRHPKG